MSVARKSVTVTGRRGVALAVGAVLTGGLIAPGVPAAMADDERADVAELSETQSVSYQGLELEVPADWKVHDLEENPSTCVRLDEPAVYLGEAGEDQDCPANVVGRAETISVEPASGDTVQGPLDAGATTLAPGNAPSLDTMSSESQEATIALSGTGLTVTARHGDNPGVVEAVLDRASYDGPERTTPTVESPELNPSATARIPSGGTATLFQGRGFDTCAAPSASTMRAWLDSPYRSVGVYIGGVNRACPDGNLSPSWMRKVTQQGWKPLPIYVGRQAPCAFQGDLGPIRSGNVREQGRAAAEDAAGRARHFGLQRGSALYYDMEGYDDTNKSCNETVLTFLSAWTERLHELGYLSGVYSSASSGIKQLSNHYNSGSYERPDVIWTARWDNKRTVWDEPFVSNNKWASHQRAKQYRGPHNETHGGRTINIDSNIINAAMSSPEYRQNVTANTALNVRNGPSTSHGVVDALSSGSNLDVVCQVAGERIESTKVWNRLTDGSYVSDAYVNTGGGDGFSSKISRCQYPHPVRTDALRNRSGPSTNHDVTGSIPRGGLAWVVCQRRGEQIEGSRVWNKLQSGNWVADWYVDTPGRPGFTDAIPRC